MQHTHSKQVNDPRGEKILADAARLRALGRRMNDAGMNLRITLALCLREVQPAREDFQNFIECMHKVADLRKRAQAIG